MDRHSQSLWDFVMLSPTQRRPAVVSEKEAMAMYDIFKAERDQQGKLIMPGHIDPTVVMSLTTKGYIANSPSRVALGNLPLRTVDFTDKGRSLIRNIILYTEKSSFSKGDPTNIDRESFIKAITGMPFSKMASGHKTASVNEQNHGSNWLTKALKWNSF